MPVTFECPHDAKERKHRLHIRAHTKEMMSHPPSPKHDESDVQHMVKFLDKYVTCSAFREQCEAAYAKVQDDLQATLRKMKSEDGTRGLHR